MKKYFLPVFFLVIPLYPQFSMSEVVLDGTLGQSGAVNGPDYRITHEMGQQHGGNLFHSFQKFGLDAGESATFSGPSSIENIISRITGGEPSFINGTIRSEIGMAGFYFINPAGIAFGKDARLDVNGSFHASTADYLRLSDNGKFSAKEPSSSSITSAAPEAFGFLGDNPGNISVATSHGAEDGAYPESGLSVKPGRTLTLAGGDVTLSHAGISAPDGRVNIAAAGSSGELDISSMSTDGFQDRGNIKAEKNSLISTGNEGGGEIYIRGGGFEMDSSSIYLVNSGKGQKGRLDISVSEKFTLDFLSVINSISAGEGNGADIYVSAGRTEIQNGSSIGSGVFSSGESGSISINTDTLDVSSGAKIYTYNEGSGRSGDIGINASASALFSGSGMYSAVWGTGSSGNISVKTPAMKISDSAFISMNSASSGNGGSLDISADEISIGSGSSISASAYSTGTGGSVSIDCADFFMDGGAQINADVMGEGEGGNIDIRASRSFRLAGRLNDGVDTGTDAELSGDEDYEYSDTAISLNSYTGATGNSGSLLVNSPEVNISGKSMLLASSLYGGNAGNIFINSETFSLSGDSTVSTSSFGGGSPGNIFIDAEKTASLSGSMVSCNNVSVYKGGLINISASDISVGNRARIEGSSNSSGSASDIKIDGSRIKLDGGSINSSAANSGKGGNITINADESIGLYTFRPENSDNNSLADSRITAFSTSTGDAGSISLKSPLVFIDSGSSVNAGTIFTGNGGDIGVSASKLMIEGAIIGSTGGSGKGGNININSDEVEIYGGGVLASNTSADPVVNPEAGIDNTEVAGKGDGGNIRINSSGSVSVHGHDMNGGESAITTSTLGTGKGGGIFIDSPDVDIYDDGLVLCATSSNFMDILNGNAGVIDISASRLFISNGGQLNGVSWQGAGTAGDIIVNASESVVVSGISQTDNQFFSQIKSDSKDSGDGGRIFINTPLLDVSDNALINVRASGSGNSGTIDINASVINLTGRSGITAQSEGAGESRSISINTESLFMDNSALALSTAFSGGGDLSLLCSEILHLNRSRITTSVAGGAGDGGNIGITGADYIILNDSGIIAQAYKGRGGNISIQSGQFVRTPESIVDASSRLGIDGDVSVDAPEQDIGSLVIKADNSFMDTPELTKDPCQTGNRTGKKETASSIIQGLRGGLPFDFSFPYMFFYARDNETREKAGGKK